MRLEPIAHRQWDLLLLYTLHGYSYREQATLLETPLGTVMSRLARTRAALKAALDIASDPTAK